jgi:catechol 2,3-dioxygenase-like lactoylglutathione lyase family enzyme
MLDHVTLAVSDLEASRDFYDAVLAAIGITRLYAEGAAFAGYGVGRKAFFWIGRRQGLVTGTHVAFAVDSHEKVRQFHTAGLVAGGRDHGVPGLRPQYHARYYGAFILDPDGHNIEAVCHI